MARKKIFPVPPKPTAGSKMIDLLLPLLAELGIEITRTNPEALAGVARGIMGERIVFVEIIGGEETCGLLFQSGTTFQDDQTITALLKEANGHPECFDNDTRWMRIAASAPRSWGGRHYMVVGKIKTCLENDSGDIREKLKLLVTHFRHNWPDGL